MYNITLKKVPIKTMNSYLIVKVLTYTPGVTLGRLVYHTSLSY